MTGRPRKPTETKIIQGTFRQDRSPKNEPKPPPVSDVPKPPAFLPTYAKKLWKRLAPDLWSSGLLTVADIPAFELCCLNYGIAVECWRTIKRAKRELADGRVLKGMSAYLAGQNSQTIPELMAAQKAMRDFKSFAAVFGLTPSDRARIDLPELKDGEDAMEQLLNER